MTTRHRWAPFRLADQTPTLTCSIGVAVYPADAQDGIGLIKQADTAMYAAKSAGKRRLSLFDPAQVALATGHADA